MIDIKKIQKLGVFQSQCLKAWEVLFDEWEMDNHIYVVVSWAISVEKKLSSEKNRSKTLAILRAWKIFWEGALNSSTPKEVTIKAQEESELLKIDAQDGMEKFLEKYPKEGLDFLKKIILLWNNRVSKANAQITATYEMNMNILKLESINLRSILNLVDIFKDIIWVANICFIEKNRAVDGYYTLRYNTNNKWKLIDEVIEVNSLGTIECIMNAENIDTFPFQIIQRINIWNVNIWYFVIWKNDEDFSETDMKIITSITNSFAWIIKQKEIFEEEKDKNFMNQN